jgi:hypothetical protein
MYQLVNSKKEFFLYICSECEEVVLESPITTTTSLKVDDFFDSLQLSRDWSNELIMISEFIPLRKYSNEMIRYIVQTSSKNNSLESYMLSQMDEQDVSLYNSTKERLRTNH